jgi:hypothetical protein
MYELNELTDSCFCGECMHSIIAPNGCTTGGASGTVGGMRWQPNLQKEYLSFRLKHLFSTRDQWLVKSKKCSFRRRLAPVRVRPVIDFLVHFRFTGTHLYSFKSFFSVHFRCHLRCKLVSASGQISQTQSARAFSQFSSIWARPTPHTTRG